MYMPIRGRFKRKKSVLMHDHGNFYISYIRPVAFLSILDSTCILAKKEYFRNTKLNLIIMKVMVQFGESFSLQYQLSSRKIASEMLFVSFVKPSN